MSERRQVWETLSKLLTRLEEDIDASLGPKAPSESTLEELEKEIRRLGKTQFKTNALVEEQSTRWEEVLAGLRAAQEQRDQLVEELVRARVAAREMELLEAFLPVLDGLEHAIASGQRYLEMRDRAAEVLRTSPNPPTAAQAIILSPADRAKLAGWLAGLRLLRERLLAILKACGVTPIPTVGHQFDPYLHVAVATSKVGEGAPGTIVAEERRGYRTPSGVLRYAEVIVYRPESEAGTD